jgi:xanthine dehydrogenase molybdopterin binding subunit
MVAVVVAASYAEARAAAAKVEVEYEPLPALLSIEAAEAAGSFHTEPHVITRGDAAAALADAPRTLEGTLHIGGQEHFYLETQAAYAEVGEDGDVRVVSSTQHPTEIQTAVSDVLHLPRNQVVVESPRMGGGFGGKETQGNTWAALVALAAWHTKRPVRVQLDRDLDLELTGKRHPFFARFRVGFDHDGTLLALDATLRSDGGWALDLSESICDRALFHLDNAYFVPNVRVEGRVCKTNCVSHTAFRGFGGPQGMVVIEEVLDRVARAVGLPPEEVRSRNLYRAGASTTHYGQEVDAPRIQRLFHELTGSSELAARRQTIQAFNEKSERVKRGIAITPVKFGISFTASFLNQAGAYVLVYRDGTVQVNHGGTEMGQGLHTKIQGIAMRELGLPASAIRLMKTATDKIPNTSPTAASAGADLNGAAVRNACETLRERLAPVAAQLAATELGRPVSPSSLVFENGRVFPVDRPDAGASFAQVVERAYLAQVPLSATGFYRTPGIGYDKRTGRGKPFYYFALGAAVAEVELDGWSGMKRVLRVDILHDVGDSLNPGIDRGQIEGGFVQGLGWLTCEELSWDDRGRLRTHSASTYAIPAFSDAPTDLRVRLLDHANQDGTVHGSKAVGEPPLMLAIAVREALRDAVAAFGEPGGEVRLPSPATHEALWHAVERRRRRT